MLKSQTKVGMRVRPLCGTITGTVICLPPRMPNDEVFVQWDNGVRRLIDATYLVLLEQGPTTDEDGRPVRDGEWRKVARQIQSEQYKTEKWGAS